MRTACRRQLLRPCWCWWCCLFLCFHPMRKIYCVRFHFRVRFDCMIRGMPIVNFDVYPQCSLAVVSIGGAMDLSSGHVVWFPNRVHSNATPYPVARSPCSKRWYQICDDYNYIIFVMLTQCTGAAISMWIQAPGKSNPILAAMNRPAHDDWALFRFCNYKWNGDRYVYYESKWQERNEWT